MVIHGYWLVFMVFQGSSVVFHGFLVGIHVFLSSFMVFGLFPWLIKVVSWFWLVSMVFQGRFMVFHGFWLVSMVLKLVSWFLVGVHGFLR